MQYPRVTEIPSARRTMPLMTALQTADQDTMNLRFQDARLTASAAAQHQRAAGEALTEASARARAITQRAATAAASVRTAPRRSRRRAS